ncbi:MAG: RtcB family protein [Elusimicrobia bacterium]|nr:RtcB family protein [Elusimicrobiota bacterium]
MPIKKIVDARVPVKIWADDVEPDALKQLKNIAALPFVFKHVAAMPDVHLGKGATVGSVIATENAVVPAAVGVDIGCGMCAVKLEGVTSSRLEGKLAELRSNIERAVPVGFHENRDPDAYSRNWARWADFGGLHERVQGLKGKALRQLGSLGGGNHFIEVCLDSADGVWVMLHSGSRNIGKSLAEHHIDSAKGLMRKMFVSLPDPDLAYFAAGTPEYDAYLRDLRWAQDYALMNREVMMGRVLEQVGRAVGVEPKAELSVNCHHNFAAMEHHFGRDVLVTRKGAVRARKGDMGIIPGSMGTKSYIVRGKGEPESFDSCSHGAGRRMSRNEARRRFGTADLRKQTEGVECRKDEGVVDEIPAAYKPIERVMADQSDLVEIVAEIKQVLCVKG